MSRPHRALGLAPGATPEEVRAAYRALARAHHPDLHGGSAEAHARFLEIAAAYAALASPGEDGAPVAEESAEALAARRAQLDRRRRRLRRLYD